ncbi:MAG TPA: hypothetical protein PLD55_06325 [bacterium]|nr:hypothetical protein [bacterium]HOG43934.1 hypothetical protein [bacterium]HPA57839.1 hypothetical protein [bacterium]HQM84285.1 hypothetical protein [bacterium]HQN73891.1 hypothetical protein [bacterium]
MFRYIIGVLLLLMMVSCGDKATQTDNEDSLIDENAVSDEISTKDYDKAEEAVNDSEYSDSDANSGSGYHMVATEYSEIAELGNLTTDNKRYEIFRDKTTFEQFFTQINVDEMEPPSVDFDNKMVIVLFNGKWNDLRPAYRLDGVKKFVFDNPEDVHSSVITVETTVLYYREDCPVDSMIYYPTYLISVDKADIVNFVDHFEIVTDC